MLSNRSFNATRSFTWTALRRKLITVNPYRSKPENYST